MCLHISKANNAAVSRFAREVVAPKVREMDEAEKMDPSIIKGLFENGVCKLQQIEVLWARLTTYYVAHGHRN
jgi:hypothetical protein